MSSTSTTWTTDTNTKSGTVQIYESNISVLKILGIEGGNSILELFADQGDDNADKWRMWVNASDDDLHFANYTSGAWADLLTIQDGGNVGIGTDSPAGALHLSGYGYPDPVLIIESTSTSNDHYGGNLIFRKADTNDQLGTISRFGTIRFEGWNTADSSWEAGAMIEGSKDGTTGAANDMPGKLTFHTAADGGTTLYERMRINSDGNVGIGTTSPDTPLHIAHPTTTIDYYENKGLLISEAGSADGLVMWSRTDSECYIGLNKDLSSGTGSHALGMNLDSNSNKQLALWIRESGKVGIGTSGPASALHVVTPLGTSAADADVAHFNHTSNTDGNCLGISIDFSAADPNDATQYFLYCEDSAAPRAVIRSNGGLANYQSNNADLSDQTLKTDIADIPSVLSTINSFAVRNFKYKDQTDDRVLTGLIAQEVEAIDSSLVDNSGDYKMIYNKDIYYMMLKAIQELSAKVTALENA